MSMPALGTVSAEQTMRLDFSVVLATRNRGTLLVRALDSVLAQRTVQLEALVVDDGSEPEHASIVTAAVVRAGTRARLLRLPTRSAGHGPSFARNSVAALATGKFITFLDDDDAWTDPQHLARCKASMDAAEAPADLLFGDQRAVLPNQTERQGPLWLRGLEQQFGRQVDAQGAHLADVATLLDRGALCHLNTTVLRRELFEAIGGFDERLRYEEDRDLCLRAIDRAARILYQPLQIGVHHVPDPTGRSNASTSMSDYDKRLAELLMYDKALLCCARPEVRRHALRAKATVLKRLSTQLQQAGRLRDAHACRLQALATDFNLKWLAATVLGRLRTLGARP